MEVNEVNAEQQTKNYGTGHWVLMVCIIIFFCGLGIPEFFYGIIFYVSFDEIVCQIPPILMICVGIIKIVLSIIIPIYLSRKKADIFRSVLSFLTYLFLMSIFILQLFVLFTTKSSLEECDLSASVIQQIFSWVTICLFGLFVLSVIFYGSLTIVREFFTKIFGRCSFYRVSSLVSQA